MKHLLVGFAVGAFLIGGVLFVKIPFLADIVLSVNTVDSEEGGEDAYLSTVERVAASDTSDANSGGTASTSTSLETDEKNAHPYRIVINIPAYKLRLYENDHVIKTYTVCVGMPGYRTPVRKMTINRIIWNPSWAPPPNAAWARGSSGRAPGKMNPVGVVKMPIRGYVYIHGTYKIKSLGFAWSHGCIRMANDDATELAWFLQLNVGSNHPEHTLETYTSNKRTYTIFLKHPVPVKTIYDTVEIEDERLLIHPDVYRHGLNTPQRVSEKIANAGWNRGNVNSEYLMKLLKRSYTETAIATKDELFTQINGADDIVR